MFSLFKKAPKPVRTDEKEIDELLSRGVEDVVVYDELKKKLLSGKRLRIKLGIDPTGPQLTLGHVVVLRKLRAFQELGHTVILLFGGYTATIGDPTGKNETRPPLTGREVAENAKTYLQQAGKILDVSRCEVRNNKEWLKKMSLESALALMAKKSVQQIITRNDFKERMKNESDIHLQEFLYPMLTGYDSVVLESDVEVGGNDQLFNILVGRDLQRKYKTHAIQDALVTKILVGTDGVEKMSKSLGNYIAITDEPNDMFGKVMSLTDSAMPDYFECLTDIDLEAAASAIRNDPMRAKMDLAYEITKSIHGEKQALDARNAFVSAFQKGEVPENVETLTVASGAKLIEVLYVSGVVESASAFRRLVDAGAVTHMDSGKKVSDHYEKAQSGVYKIGKKRFVKINAR